MEPTLCRAKVIGNRWSQDLARNNGHTRDLYLATPDRAESREKPDPLMFEFEDFEHDQLLSTLSPLINCVVDKISWKFIN